MSKLFLLISLIFLLFVFSCSTTSNEKYVEFIVKVDSLHHPNNVAIYDTITLELFGTIGGDGCFRFSHFYYNETALELNLTVIGIRPNFETVCPAVMVYLNGLKFETIAEQKGAYQINIHQPNGDILTDSIVVQ